MRYRMLSLLLCVGACSSDRDEGEAAPRSAWGTFIGAFSDELRGAPSAESLKKTRRFDQAGVAFDYPAVLRLTVDTDSYPSWTLTHGDLDLEVHAPDSDFASRDYLVSLADAFDSEGAPSEGPESGVTVIWCGASITAVRVRLSILGDRHELLGFDLPGAVDGNRFVIFDDMLVDGRWSNTAQAAFEELSNSIRCDQSVRNPLAE